MILTFLLFVKLILHSSAQRFVLNQAISCPGACDGKVTSPFHSIWKAFSSIPQTSTDVTLLLTKPATSPLDFSSLTT